MSCYRTSRPPRRGIIHPTGTAPKPETTRAREEIIAAVVSMLVFCVLVHCLQLFSDMIKNPQQGELFPASGFKTDGGYARRGWMRGIGVVVVRHQ